MGGLLSALHNSSNALNLFGQALGAEQSNVANAATPGYAVRNVSVNPLGLSGTGGSSGDFIQLSSPNAAFVDAAVQAASTEASGAQTQAQQLSVVNQQFDITGTTGILAALQQFGTAFAGLSASPNDPALGAAALNAVANVASAFQTTARTLSSQRGQVDSSIQSATAQINSLANRIAGLNVKAANQVPVDPSVDANLRNALDQLSGLVDVTVNRNTDGTVSVLAGSQLPLVLGDRAYTLGVNPAAAVGAQVTSSGGGNSSAAFSGQLGALLDIRNGTYAAILGTGGSPGTLNQLASGFASRVNALLTSGVNQSGGAGVPVYTFDPANAAATLAIDPTVTASQLGLSSGGASGQSNAIGNQLAALPGSTAAVDQITGLSAVGLFGAIASSVGQQLSDANTASTAAKASLTSAQTSRQQAIGVSIDQEAVNITADQRAYQANAQVVSILNQLTQVAVDLIK